MKLTNLTKIQETYEESLNKAEVSVSREYVDSKLGISDNYTKTILWENSSGMTVVSPIVLIDDYINYDLVVFELAINGLNNIQQFTIDTTAFEMNVNCCLSYQTKSMGIVPISNNSFTAVTWDGGNTYVIQKIYGVKLGARRPYSETTLYEATTTSFVTPITLSQTFDDFDLINISYGYGSVGTIVDTKAFLVSSLNKNGLNELRLSNYDTWQILLVMDYDNTTTVNITGHNMGSENYIAKITGVKFGGSVKGRNVTTLFNNTGNVNPASITLPAAYTMFDEIIVTGHETNNTAIEKFILPDALKINDYISLQSGNTYCNYLVASETSLTFANALNLVISNITGIKYDSDYITIDSEMSSTSENPVQNKIIKNYVDTLIDELEQRIIALENRI